MSCQILYQCTRVLQAVRLIIQQLVARLEFLSQTQLLRCSLLQSALSPSAFLFIQSFTAYINTLVSH